VSAEIREFFQGRGIDVPPSRDADVASDDIAVQTDAEPCGATVGDDPVDEVVVEPEAEDEAGEALAPPVAGASLDEAGAVSDPLDAADVADEAQPGTIQRLSQMNVTERMKAASKGTREERAILIRDPNRLVSAAVIGSPKLTDTEVESFAKMANVSPEILRTIGSNRAWLKNYNVVAALVRNPKTPVALSLNLIQRLNDRDMKMLSIDRNVPEPLRVAARKKIFKEKHK
jgi:hypothetical protein